MNTKHAGFFLLEVVLYGFITTFICLVIMSSTLAIIHSLSSLSKKVAAAREPYAVLLLLEKDLEKTSIFCDNETTLCFKKKQINENQEIYETWGEWRLINNRLERSEGTYDEQKKQWLERKGTIVLQALSSFSWKFHKKNSGLKTVMGITITLSTKQHKIVKTIILKNREIA